jgi:hypothetical protein
MSTTFISFDSENGFWINDALTQVVCWGLVNVIDYNNNSDISWIRGEYREYLYNCSQGIFVGFTDLRLGDYLINDQRIASFKNLLKQTEDYFIAKGYSIPIDELNSFQLVKETKREWTSPLEVSRILKILEYLKNLVNRTLTIKAGDEIDYEF